MSDATFSWSVLAGAGLVWLLAYLLVCWFWPLGWCRRCKGTGKKFSPPNRRKFRLCPRCGGNGRRPRLGHRALNFLGRRKAST